MSTAFGLSPEMTYLLIAILAVVDAFEICLCIYLYFAVVKYIRLEREIKAANAKILAKAIDRSTKIPIYGIDESEAKKKYAPRFYVKSLSLDGGHIYYNTKPDVEFRSRSEEEFRTKILNKIVTKLSTNK